MFAHSNNLNNPLKKPKLMKKSLLIVFCAAILLCLSFGANAQTLGVSSSSAQTDGFVVRPLGGEWGVSILVTDIYSRPIPGALVNAPCTGQGSQYTNSTGHATFAGSGSCPCTQSPVTVTTGACNKQVKVSCGTTLVMCP